MSSNLKEVWGRKVNIQIVLIFDFAGKGIIGP
jgi:hypothetical protein